MTEFHININFLFGCTFTCPLRESVFFTYNPFPLWLDPEKLSLSNPELSQTWQNRTIQLLRAHTAREGLQKEQGDLQTWGTDKQLQGSGSSVSTPPLPWFVGNVTMVTWCTCGSGRCKRAQDGEGAADWLRTFSPPDWGSYGSLSPGRSPPVWSRSGESRWCWQAHLPPGGSQLRPCCPLLPET